MEEKVLSERLKVVIMPEMSARKNRAPAEGIYVNRRILGALMIVLALAAAPAFAQQSADVAELKKTAPKVFIDCNSCDLDYIRTEIPFVNYVRDRKEADVHVLITTQQTGSGGTEYCLAFIGLGPYAGTENKLLCAVSTTDTEEEVRRSYVAVLRMGLIPYTARTPIRALLSIELKEQVKPTDVVDPWKFWVFSAEAGGDIENETQRSQTSLEFSLSANKVTPEMKLQLGAWAEFDREEFEYRGQTIVGRRENTGFRALFVKSLGEHWSAGIFVDAESSTYENIDFSLRATPAVEYDFFPYSESTRRQLRILYRIGPGFVRYREETLFMKMRETLFGEALSATLEIKEPWGSLEASLVGSHYFHDFSKNRLEFWTELSFRIFKGLDFNIDGGYERIRDQLSLPKGDATLEEVLLEQKQLATEYQLNFRVSLSYTFGSIFSNVVNPRFGNQHYY